MESINDLKFDPDQVNYHYDHARRIQTEQWSYYNKAEQMPKMSESKAPQLQRHDIFPGYVSSKPYQLSKAQNISRTLEGCTATNKRHFVATSNNTIAEMMKEKRYKQLLKFVLDTILDILRHKLALIPKCAVLAKRIDDLAMTELCAHNNLISYPDFIQIVQVINNVDRVTEAQIDDSNRDFYDNPQLMSKYIPQYRPGTTYNFHEQKGFKQKSTEVSESEAKTAIRILVDFMKTETMKQKDLSFEPLLTQLIALK